MKLNVGEIYKMNHNWEDNPKIFFTVRIIEATKTRFTIQILTRGDVDFQKSRPNWQETYSMYNKDILKPLTKLEQALK